MLLLSSSAFEDPRLLHRVLATTGRRPPAVRAAVLVSASPAKGTGPNALKTMTFLREQGFTDPRFLDFDDDGDCGAALEASDLILVNGGDPIRLLAALQRHRFRERLRALALSPRIVVGVSAGGMVFSPDLALLADLNRILGVDPSPEGTALDDLAGLNLFDDFFLPHFDRFSEKVPDLRAQLGDLEAARDVTFYCQPNGRTAVVENRTIRELF